MEYLKRYWNPFGFYILIGVLVFTNIGSVYYFMNFAKTEEPIVCPECPVLEEQQEEKEVVFVPTIKVDIKGYVNHPGVYEVNDGTIVDELIAMAGGLKTNGTTDNINLSKKLNNEDMIVVLSKTELKKAQTSQTASTATTNSKENSVSEKITSSKKISLNTSSQEELMTLYGIGEAKAQAILEYRKTNPFKEISEIMNISGIGESIYEKIKDYITI